MTISQEELGRRLRTAREACHMTQDDVGGQLGVSRSTIAQMELGNRAVTGLELGRLAYVFGRDIREFVGERFEEEDVLVALFRMHPEIAHEGAVAQALRSSLKVGRDLSNLKRMLRIDRDAGSVASYPLTPPQSRWEAIQQGERIADEERRRLEMGVAPVPTIADLLETQAIHTAQIAMPEDISGMTLIEKNVGFFVVVNRDHHVLRRRFSFAHEYCHVLADRDRRGTVSRSRDRDELIEVRANAFAAAFLMPEMGVRRFVRTLGKGRASRAQIDVFDEDSTLAVEGRLAPGSQDIQLYDIVPMAHHFGVSRLAAIYRLRNLRLISREQLDSLKAQEEAGAGLEMARMLDLPEPDYAAARNEFRHRFLGLAFEAFRRDEITRSKLVELAETIDVPRSEVEKAMQELGLDADDEGAAVQIPES